MGVDQEQVVPGQKRIRDGSDSVEHPARKRSRSTTLQRLQGALW